MNKGEFPTTLLSEAEAAKRLGVSRVTLLRLRRRGAISHFRVATRVLFSEAHIQEFLERAELKAA